MERDCAFFIKPKLLSWNVRVLNEDNKCLQIKNLLCEWKANIICLQETKLKFISRKSICSFWSCNYVDWAYLTSDGVLGDVLVMWDRMVVEKMEEFLGAYSFKSVVDNFMWAFAGIYGTNLDS